MSLIINNSGPEKHRGLAGDLASAIGIRENTFGPGVNWLRRAVTGSQRPPAHAPLRAVVETAPVALVPPAPININGGPITPERSWDTAVAAQRAAAAPAEEAKLHALDTARQSQHRTIPEDAQVAPVTPLPVSRVETETAPVPDMLSDARQRLAAIHDNPSARALEGEAADTIDLGATDQQATIVEHPSAHLVDARKLVNKIFDPSGPEAA